MDDFLLNIFREESCEHLAGLEQRFLDLETTDATDARRPIIDQLFRHAHTLKGNAKGIGIPELQKTAQVLEDHLDGLRESPESINRESIDTALKQLDAVRQSYEQWQQAQELPTDDLQLPIEEETDGSPIEDAPDQKSKIQIQKSDESVRVASGVLDRMLSVSGELRISGRSADALAQQLATLREHLTALQQNLQARTQIENQQFLEAALDQVQRVQTEHRKKYSRETLLLESLETDIRQARLLPLAPVAESLRRTIRDLAQTLGKSIRFEIDVGNVLLDKAVIEALPDPLMHLIRNAADHGIETPDERKAAGKSDEATICIAASRRGDRVRITITDDGRGVNYDKIRERVRQMQELDEAELGQLTESQLGRFLFRPGFTTRTTSDAISGRGVGLDVVLDAVKRLQGTVEVMPNDQDPDQKSKIKNQNPGTTFVITVPVTISTVRILTVLNDGQVYGIPSSAIIRTGSAKPEELRELEGHSILTIDDEPVRWTNLSDLLGAESTWQTTKGQRRPYLLLSHNGQRIAVAVDDLEEELEVLLKPLGFPLGGLPGIVGATIRPNGSVQLVLDLSSAVVRGSRRAVLPDQEQPAAAVRVLVVDDSPTTRALLRNVLSAAGFSVKTATDGVDALDHLATQTVDLVVSDVEMPRMNGFELTRQIKSKLGLPVILVTSLAKDEHRRQGMEAGADAYVDKSSFHGEGLLEIMKQFV